MTSIKWPGALTGGLTDLTGSLRTPELIPGQNAGVSGLAQATQEYAQSASAQRRLRLGGALAQSLDSALRRLDEAASGFAWPTEGIPFAVQSRLAVVPPARAADLSARVPGQAAVIPEDKFLSRGFRASDPTSLEAGTYALTLGLGSSADSLAVTVESGWTNAQVLNAVAGAVNGSTLAVDAEVQSQTGSGILGPGVIPTGSFLALSTNLANQAQNPTLTDSSGHLAAWLQLSASATPMDPAGPAETGSRQLTSLAVARPTTYRSMGRDPEAVTTLAPGTYTVAYAVGPDSGSVLSGSVDLVVNAGDTWREVFAHMARVLGSASPAMLAQLVPAKRVWDSAPDAHGNEKRAVVDATGLEVQLQDPKPGWRLTLSGGARTGGPENILSATGLSVTAQPGSDGRMTVDGRDRTRTPGVFAADQGRVVFEQFGTFGEVVPVAVMEPLDRLSQGLSDVVAAYNGLRGLLVKNADQLRPGLAEDWRAPVADRALGLVDLGLVETGQDKTLWLQARGFVQALVTDAAGVRRMLLGDGGAAQGLLPALAGKAQDALSAGAENLLLPQDAFAPLDPSRRSPSLRTEAEVEKASQLLDLFDTAPRTGPEPLPWEGGTPLVRRRG